MSVGCRNKLCSPLSMFATSTKRLLGNVAGDVLPSVAQGKKPLFCLAYLNISIRPKGQKVLATPSFGYWSQKGPNLSPGTKQTRDVLLNFAFPLITASVLIDQ